MRRDRKYEAALCEQKNDVEIITSKVYETSSKAQFLHLVLSQYGQFTGKQRGGIQ